MEGVLSHVVDPALKTVLAAGVAFFFKVCDERVMSDCA